jgi:RNA polymerase sigma-70 factor (ECF subfamily)
MLEDRLLVWKFKRGSEEAFRRIYEKYVDNLLTLAANLLHDTNAAEDVVQDVFVSFLQSAENFHLRGSLKSYLSICVANRSRDRIRKMVRQQALDIDEAEKTSGKDEPVHLAVQNEQLHRLQKAMRQLPYEQHEAITLRLHGGLKFRQIAELQNVSIKTVQGRYRYGLDKLRSILNHELEK